MDPLDIRILRAMGPFPYGTPATGADALRPARIAREVGVSAETVRERIARMETAGVIGGYDLVPNLRHFGLEASAFLLRAPDESQRERFRKALENVEGLLEVTYFLGPETCVDISFSSNAQRDRRVRALGEAAGDPAPIPFLGWNMPPVARELTRLDWRIVRALRGRAKRSLVEVSEELGIGYRTVKRHYDRMAEEGSFLVKPLIDPAAEPGLLPFGLLFHFARDAPADTTARVLAAFDDHFVFAHPPLSAECGNLDVMMFADSPAQVEQMRQRGAAIPGVARVQALLLTEVEPRMDWIDELIDARLATRGVADPPS